MTELRVLSLVPYRILPAKLGGEKGIALFNEFLAKELELIAVGVKSNDTREAHNYQFLNILPDSRTRYGNPFLYFRLRKQIRKNRCNVLIIEHPYYGWLAWLLKKTTNLVWVVHSHNIEFERSKSIGRKWWPALKWYERWVYKQSDINFYISDDDRHYAIDRLGIAASKSHTITYGIEIAAIPSDIDESKKKIRKQFSIDARDTILLFNGTLSVISNEEALDIILNKINPGLLESGRSYKIIICGKGLPARFNELKEYKDSNIVYAGFVDDISVYFKAADIFLNPIISGAGVKTKAIEAIAYNSTVISSELGAMGIIKEVCGNKLQIVANANWNAFTSEVIRAIDQPANTPREFYQYYYWSEIAKKATDAIKAGIKKAPGKTGG